MEATICNHTQAGRTAYCPDCGMYIGREIVLTSHSDHWQEKVEQWWMERKG